MSDNILDMRLRDWLQVAAVGPRPIRVYIRTSSEVVRLLEDTAKQKGWSRSRVAHLALLFGLAALAKYWEETKGVEGDEL